LPKFDAPDGYGGQLAKAARAYQGRGWAVTPLRPGDKAPRWDGWQRRPAMTEEEIQEQFEVLESGVGIRTGRISGTAVLDFDVKHGGLETPAKLLGSKNHRLPETATVATGGGGQHWYYAHDKDLPSRHPMLPGMDLQAEGTQVAAPPTIHASGLAYKWLVTMRQVGALPTLPEWILEEAGKAAKRPLIPAAGEPIPRGSQHDALLAEGNRLVRELRGTSEYDKNPVGYVTAHLIVFVTERFVDQDPGDLWNITDCREMAQSCVEYGKSFIKLDKLESKEKPKVEKPNMRTPLREIY
jgi:hypothetical protein